MTFKTKPPLGFKKVSDWVGTRIKNIHPMQNAYVKVPAHSSGTVTSIIHGKGLTITFDECSCCGVSAIISGIRTEDIMQQKDVE
ncbi:MULTISPECIES: hypothetical protein [Acinetobacter]|uniref:Uncharacterized protein n=1 Tax=Acinetobacter higginsii TaxID=70347 RepID=N9SUI5_9GAMM|nr:MULTISPECIES: hypothetical protein [Acinetobacter]ENX58336.1 hypothetical protein F902_02736 [Acinetobacter higginsii]